MTEINIYGVLNNATPDGVIAKAEQIKDSTQGKKQSDINADYKNRIENLESSSGGTTDYTDLANKPQINGHELSGNKSASDLGLQAAGDYALKSEIPDTSNLATKEELNNITPTIGENGNWFINGEDTGKPANGKDGADGVSLGEIALVQETGTESGSENKVMSQKAVSEKLTELETITEPVNYKNGENILSGKTTIGNDRLVSTQGLTSTSPNSYELSSFVPVKPGQKFCYHRENPDNTSSTGVSGYTLSKIFYVYDKDGGTNIDNRIGNLVNSSNSEKDIFFTIPDGIYYIKACAKESENMSIYFCGFLTDNDIDYENNGEKRIASSEILQDVYDTIIEKEELIDSNELITEKVIMDDNKGTYLYVSTFSTKRQEFIPVNEGDILFYTGVIPAISGTAIGGFKEDKSYASEKRQDTSTRAVGAILLANDLPLKPDLNLNYYKGDNSVANYKVIVPPTVKFVTVLSKVDENNPDFSLKILRKKFLDSIPTASAADVSEGDKDDVFITPKALKDSGVLNSGGSGNMVKGIKGSITDFGCVADAKILYDAETTSGSDIVDCENANFTQEDVGKSISIPYAGEVGSKNVACSYLGTIVEVVSNTSIRVSSSVQQTIVKSRTINDFNISANSKTLRSNSANFTYTDIGKEIRIKDVGELRANAGSNNAMLSARIVGFTSSTEVTISVPAIREGVNVEGTINGATVVYGTDNTSKLQQAIDETSYNKDILFLEKGYYLTKGYLEVKDYLHIKGAGRQVSMLYPIGDSEWMGGIKGEGRNTNNPYTDVVFESFGIDNIGCTLNSYTSTSKCLYITFMQRPIFRDLFLANSCGTALGCDFLRDYLIESCILFRGGRQVKELGNEAGGSGIGIGTGYWTSENGLVIGNTALECGNNGIFFESQSGSVQSHGIRCIGNYAKYCKVGIADKATKGSIIANNIVELCERGIYVGVGFNPILFSSDGIICDNILNGCNIVVTFEEGSYRICNNTINPFSAEHNYNMNSQISIELGNKGKTKNVFIENNYIHDTKGYKVIALQSNCPLNMLVVKGNTIRNIDDTSVNVRGIDVSSNVNYLYVENNIICDDRDTYSKLKNGIILEGDLQIKRFVCRNNDIFGATSDIDKGTATINKEISDMIVE